MNTKIINYLKQIEIDKNIEILLACETGSRAWGFPSPDSDYDVRFIYKHKADWYLNLQEQKDTIEVMYEDNEFDLSGWDLKKTMQLLWKSNPPLLERIQSPIIYISNIKFIEEINELSKSTYSKIATMHHYLNMSKKIFVEITNQKEIKLKKFFYALRTAVACKWIIEKESIPPIVFQNMLEGLEFDITITSKIYQLIELKSHKDESYLHPIDSSLLQFIEELIQEADLVANTLPKGKGKIDELNQFFKNTLFSL